MRCLSQLKNNYQAYGCGNTERCLFQNKTEDYGRSKNGFIFESD